MASALSQPLRDEPTWPQPSSDGRRVVFLMDASSRLEQRLLEGWIERARAGDDAAEWDRLRIPPTRRRRPVSLSRLEACLASESDVLLAPLRVVWLARKHDGQRTAHFSDLLRLGDPRDPGTLRQQWILRHDPDRCRIVAGEPATASELRERWRGAGGVDLSQTTGLAEFVARQAGLALERAERRVRGARYKVPRLVEQDILGRPAFVGGLANLARETGHGEARVTRDAARYLREIAATHSPYVIDLVAHLIRMLYTRGYGEALHYDREKLREIQALAQRHPVVFLPSHKSNLDHLVLQYMLHENELPPNHTAGGINMNFFPVGPLVRRSGVFFIRRSFKDNPVYKFVLRHYIDYLIDKRFSLEWYVEGGRSRSGKLLPPRFGLLAYVVDAHRRGIADDVLLIPVSIAYDQIGDVQDYAAEQTGAKKERESFGWFVKFVRRLHRRYGNIHFAFGDPISLTKAMGAPDPGARPNPDEENLALQKLAFEVCVRINAVTPITPTSLVTMALLGAGERAQTVSEVAQRLENLLGDVERRQLPTTGDLELDTPEGLTRALDSLVENDVVTRFSEGDECVYLIGPDQQLAAAYYRNTIIHFFVTPAIAELSLLYAAEAPSEARIDAFWSSAMALRDVLKFEFVFAEKERFRGEMRRELAGQDSEWERVLQQGPVAIQDLMRRFRPFNAHRVLRPFLEAYRIVAEHLERCDATLDLDRNRFLSECRGVGRQYHLQRRIHSADSISQVLFQSALRLAENRELLDAGQPDLQSRRAAFADEIRSALRHVDVVDALAASRRAGVID